MTELKLLNLFAQFFFVRVTRCRDAHRYWFGIAFFIVPFTGWNSDFISVGELRHLRISEIKSSTKNL